MRITIVQCDINKGEIFSNLKRLDSVLSSSQEIIVLPEMFNCAFSDDVSECAETETNSVTLNWMKQKAEQLNCCICGSIPVVDEGRLYNRLYFVRADKSVTHYDKRHLFSMGSEHETFSSGAERVVVDVEEAKCLLQICYDLRFPVWSRNKNDYDVAIYVANWPSSRKDVWLTLLKARAIENQCYVVGVNRVGECNGIRYSGDSVVYDPRGKIILSTEDNKQEVKTVDINIESLHEFRKKFPVLNDADLFEIK